MIAELLVGVGVGLLLEPVVVDPAAAPVEVPADPPVEVPADPPDVVDPAPVVVPGCGVDAVQYCTRLLKGGVHAVKHCPAPLLSVHQAHPPAVQDVQSEFAAQPGGGALHESGALHVADVQPTSPELHHVHPVAAVHVLHVDCA